MKTTILISLFFLTVGFVQAVEVPGCHDFWVPQSATHTHYSYHLNLNEQKNRLECKGTIRVVNFTKRPLQRIILDTGKCPPNDLKLSVEGKPVTIVEMAKNGLSSTQMMIDLPVSLKESAALFLEIQLGFPFPSGQNQVNVVDWFPHLWWGYETVDDYDIQCDFPDEYTLVTSGLFDTEQKRFSARGIRSFGLVLLRNCKVIHTRSGDTEINCYFEAGAEKCADLIAKTAEEVIDFYRNWLGFYPHKILHIVPGGLSNPAGGYPIATSIVGIHGQKQFDSAPESHWRFITAHEIGHQYWMEHVLQAPDEFWLMIGLGVYADRAFMRANGYGDKHERDMMKRYVEGVRENLDTRIDRTAEEVERVTFDYNNIVTHGKGFAIISALAYTLGNETFESAYRRCLTEFAGRPLRAADFQRICEEESSQNLDWFFDPWLRTNQFLSYEIASHDIQKKENRYEMKERIRRSGTLRMSIPVTAYFEDGSSQVQYTNRLLDESELTFTSQSPLKEIELDARGELPLVIPPPDATIKQLKDAIEALDYTGAAEKALQIYKKVGQQEIDGEGFLFKLGMCLYDGKHNDEALECFKNCAERGRKGDKKWEFIGSAWQGILLDLLNRREEAIACYRQALDSDYNDYFRHDQYGLKIDRAWIEQRLKTPFQQNE